MARSYPLEQSDDRTLPADFAGEVLIWDIDKTYLNTHFSTWRGLLAIPFEFAVDKEAIPGAVPLLRALRHGPGERSRITPLYFVSASPPQLREVIERRMVLDGVEFDGISFKDQLRLLLGRRPRALREQVGYKLNALLRYRRRHPDGARYLLFGDDVELDAEIFSLFGEICAGLRGTPLRRRLRELGAPRGDAEEIGALADPLRATACVERIYIHLTRGTDPDRFGQLGEGVVAGDFLTQAVHLAAGGRIRGSAIAEVAREVIGPDASPPHLEERLGREAERLKISAARVAALREELHR